MYLVLKKDGEEGPDVKGGYPDALIVHASKMQKVSENGKFSSESVNESLTISMSLVHNNKFLHISNRRFKGKW